MLKENQEVISFYPGFKKNGKAVLGRIEVHDRAKVESKILPRYFNHSSFASLRRQLNYFCFIRLGKGRQKGATYCNEAVIVMDDILKLKRRSHVGGTSSTPLPPVVPLPSRKHKRSISISSSEESMDDEDVPASALRPLKKPRLPTVTPPNQLKEVLDLKKLQNRQPTVVLDLTVPRLGTNHESLSSPLLATPPPPPRRLMSLTPSPSSPFRDAEVLAGCRALLCFSRGPSNAGGVVI